MSTTKKNKQLIQRIDRSDYDGSVIFYVSLSFLSTEEAITVLNEFEDQALTLSIPYFVIWDGRDFFASYEFQQLASKIAETTKSQGRSVGAVAITLDPLKKLLTRAIKVDMLFADNREQAFGVAHRFLNQKRISRNRS